MILTYHKKIFESLACRLIKNFTSGISKYSKNTPMLLSPMLFKRNIHLTSVKNLPILLTKNIFENNNNLYYLKSQKRFIDTKVESEDKTVDPFTSDSSLTVRQILEICKRLLKKEKIDEPELSSQYIISKALNIKRVELVKYLDNVLPTELVEDVKRMMECRLSRMPIQYILGDWDFHSIKIKLRPPVFIPRPETEELVNMAVSIIKNDCNVDNPVILDIGCGSGAISLAMLYLLPNLTCVAVDQCKYAVDLTLENAKDLNLYDRLHVVHGEVKETFPSLPFEKFDLIISNPPYIPQKDIINLQPEIKLYEDIRAVFGGVVGLDVIKRIILQGQYLLKEDGRIVMEIDSSQRYTLTSWMEKNETTMIIEQFSQSFINNVPRYVQLQKKKLRPEYIG